jgi:hypothetical protein
MAELSSSRIPKRLLNRLQDVYRHSRAPHFGMQIWEEQLTAPNVRGLPRRSLSAGSAEQLG